MKQSVIITCLILIFVNSAVSAQQLELLGSCAASGYSYDGAIIVRGDYAYVSDNPYFSVINISDPYHPEKIASIDADNWHIEDIGINGSYAYLATWDGPIRVINIARPDSPFVVSTFQPWPSQGHRLFINKRLLYLANCDRNFPIINISNPCSLYTIGTFNQGFGDAIGVFVRDTIAYYASWYTGLHIVNIANPADPVQIGHLSTPDNYTGDIGVSGNYAYLLTEGPNKLSVIDISSPSNPEIVRNFSYDIFGSAHWLHISSNHLLVAHRYLTIYDISDPGNPIEIINYTDIDNKGVLDVYMLEDLIYTHQEGRIAIYRLLPTGIDENLIPREISIQSYPNPFNAQTTISYSLSESGPVTLAIYNLLGQKVATLLDEVQTAGEHSVIWDTTNGATGVYLAVLKNNNLLSTKKLLLLR